MPGGRAHVVLTSYGVTIEVAVDEERLLRGVMAILPPGWEPGDPEAVAHRFALAAAGTVVRDGEAVVEDADDARALAVLDTAIRAVVALGARDRIFVHAGVVALGGRAIVLPGASFAGKTTLVAALVGAGAEYYSDEFAVLDRGGAVHPYPKPLSLRRPGGWLQVDVPVESLGGAPGAGSAAVAAIVQAPYAPGATWNPVRGTAGEGAMVLLEHSIAARSRPSAVLTAVTRAAEHAVFLQGPRGEADATAGALLDLIGGCGAPSAAA